MRLDDVAAADRLAHRAAQQDVVDEDEIRRKVLRIDAALAATQASSSARVES